MLLSATPRTSHAADLKGARGEAERAKIERTLVETGGRIGLAAKRLKISRTTLWTRMKSLGIGSEGYVQKTEHRN
jgi:transcriptional regulator of acetoin/glycerol metabolism